MRKLFTSIAAAAFTFAAPALAEPSIIVEPVFADAEADAAGVDLAIEPGYIGARTGDPEKDTFGYDRSGQANPPSTAPRFSRQPRHIGLLSSDPEDETWGFIIVPYSAR